MRRSSNASPMIADAAQPQRDRDVAANPQSSPVRPSAGGVSPVPHRLAAPRRRQPPAPKSGLISSRVMPLPAERMGTPNSFHAA